MTRPRLLRPSFTAVTWNLRYSVPAAHQFATIRRLRDRHHVTIFLCQEFEALGIGTIFVRAGLELVRADRRAVAWDPAVWRRVERRRPVAVQLARRAFTRWPSGSRVNTDAGTVILEHRVTGHRVLAVSIHTPSGVQRAGRPTGRRDGLAVLRESMRTIAGLARRVGRRVDAILVGGDDNADERRHPAAWAPYNGDQLTGLTTVRAPAATHAGGRRIDDFRVAGLSVFGGGTTNTPGDHDAHFRRFRFKRPARRVRR